MRKLVDECDEARHLHRGEAIRAPLRDFLRAQCGARLEYNGGEDFILAQFGWHCNGRDFEHARMRLDHAVDLGTGNVLAPAADDVFLWGNKKVITVGVRVDKDS